MYFDHRFPLTSHIRGHLLLTQIELLHLSAHIIYVGTQKDKHGELTWWNKAVSKVEEVETVEVIKVKGLTNLK